MKNLSDNLDEDVPDRMNELPDHIILQILSLLPIDDAVRASIVSKRWAYLWTNLAFRDFGISTRPYSGIHYIQFIDCSLLLHRNSDVNKFSVNFAEYRSSFADNVNRWVHLMTSANVKELALEFEGYDSYMMPTFLYTNAALTKLRVSNCSIDSYCRISWNLLQSLYIGKTRLTDTTIFHIFKGCPSLKLIELSSCYGFRKLVITSRHLSKLLVRDYLERDAILYILAPFLQSLTISGKFLGCNCTFYNARSLIDCCLDFNTKGDFNLETAPFNILSNLIEVLFSVRNFTFGEWCMQALSKMEEMGICFPMRGAVMCKKLDVETKTWGFAGIVYLLKGFRHLERLSIDMIPCPCEGIYFTSDFLEPPPGKEIDWEFQKLYRWNLRLKTVKISGFTDEFLYHDHSALHLIEFLVKNARLLENLTVIAVNFSAPGLLELTEKLLSFPRSSSNAVITVLER